jgi:hypothetical protein
MTSKLQQLRTQETVQDASARSCLVINGNKLQQLDLDGPALRIALQEQSTRLFPLRRLARIHVIGELHCGFEALLHCAEKQIPVAFFGQKGKLRCQLYYPVFENSVLAHWLEHIEFDHEIRKLYDGWMHLQKLHLLGNIGCRDGANTCRQDLAEQRLHHLLNKHWSRTQQHEAREWLQGMLTVHISQMIVQQGLANQSRSKRKLLEDLLPICELWLLYLLVVAIVEQKKPPAVNAHGMSRFYQQHADSIEYTVQRMLAQLVNRLEAIV